jgi:hypothetical protein
MGETAETPELVWPEEIRAHANAVMAGGRRPAWRQRGAQLVCSYCGSARPQDLYEGFRDVQPTRNPVNDPYPGDPDTTSARDFRDWYTAHVREVSNWSGMGWADWKYGYPHKIYPSLPGSGFTKFYVAHLADLDERELAVIADLIDRFTGVLFYADAEGRLCYRARHLELPPAGGTATPAAEAGPSTTTPGRVP